jgi:hypothetical protein
VNPQSEDVLKILSRELATEFARLAGIPGKDDLFSSLVYLWGDFVLSNSDDLKEFLYDIKNKAYVLQEQLEKLKTRLHPIYFSDEPLETIRFSHDGQFRGVDDLDEKIIGKLLEERRRAWSALSSLTELLAKIVPSRRKGRTRGRKSYTGLADLVYYLEHSAQFGGGSFKCTRKHGVPKGSLVLALNLLRKRLAQIPELKATASLLPTPDSHPTGVYDAALTEARNDAASLRSLRQTSPKIEN